jgi:hypothetical protein
MAEMSIVLGTASGAAIAASGIGATRRARPPASQSPQHEQ